LVDGDVLSDAQLASGGIVAVLSGGAAMDTTLRGSNTILGSGLQGVSTGTFLPGHGVGGKPDHIDLPDIAFGTTKKSQVSFTGAASNLSGTLTVTDGVHSANIVLLGQYAASEFAAANDGQVGTHDLHVSVPTGATSAAATRSQLRLAREGRRRRAREPAFRLPHRL
jgi:hypothetical protein